MAATIVGARARDFGVAASLSAALVSPLVVLEAVNRTTGERLIDAVVLFTILWLLPVGFLMTILSIVRNDSRVSMRLVLAIAAALAIAFVWGSLLIDQWPCFMGVPNCD